MTNYIAYYRVSTKMQGRSGLGLEAQQETVRGLIGGIPAQEYIEVESGRKRNRPKLSEAIQAARKTKSTLVVAKLDRLARNARYLLEIQESGIDIMFCDMPQLDGHMGKFMVTIMAAVAELESGMISDRTTKALAAAKERGVKLGTTGKDRAAENKTKAMMFAEYMKKHVDHARSHGHETSKEIGEYFNDQGIPSSSGGKWHPQTVQRVMARLNA